MTPIRNKLLGKLGRQFGDEPPSWASDGGLGRADDDPAGICSGLGLAGFQGAGDDWLVDITNLLKLAVRSQILYGLYSEPTPKGNRTGLSLSVRSDLANFSGAVTMRMIKSTLWAAEQQGKIAMPRRLKVGLTSGGRVVTVQVE